VFIITFWDRYDFGSISYAKKMLTSILQNFYVTYLLKYAGLVTIYSGPILSRAKAFDFTLRTDLKS